MCEKKVTPKLGIPMRRGGGGPILGFRTSRYSTTNDFYEILKEFHVNDNSSFIRKF